MASSFIIFYTDLPSRDLLICETVVCPCGGTVQGYSGSLDSVMPCSEGCGESYLFRGLFQDDKEAGRNPVSLATAQRVYKKDVESDDRELESYSCRW